MKRKNLPIILLLFIFFSSLASTIDAEEQVEFFISQPMIQENNKFINFYYGYSYFHPYQNAHNFTFEGKYRVYDHFELGIAFTKINPFETPTLTTLKDQLHVFDIGLNTINRLNSIYAIFTMIPLMGVINLFSITTVPTELSVDVLMGVSELAYYGYQFSLGSAINYRLYLYELFSINMGLKFTGDYINPPVGDASSGQEAFFNQDTLLRTGFSYAF